VVRGGAGAAGRRLLVPGWTGAARFNPADQDLGLDSVKQTPLDARSQPAAAIADRVFRRARAFGPQLDDQTILLVTRRVPAIVTGA